MKEARIIYRLTYTVTSSESSTVKRVTQHDTFTQLWRARLARWIKRHQAGISDVSLSRIIIHG